MDATNMVTDEMVQAFARAHGFTRDITWYKGGLYDFIRISGWTPGPHCWSFMDIKPCHLGISEVA